MEIIYEDYYHILLQLSELSMLLVQYLYQGDIMDIFVLQPMVLPKDITFSKCVLYNSFDVQPLYIVDTFYNTYCFDIIPSNVKSIQLYQLLDDIQDT